MYQLINFSHYHRCCSFKVERKLISVNHQKRIIKTVSLNKLMQGISKMYHLLNFGHYQPTNTKIWQGSYSVTCQLASVWEKIQFLWKMFNNLYIIALVLTRIIPLCGLCRTVDISTSRVVRGNVSEHNTSSEKGEADVLPDESSKGHKSAFCRCRSFKV